MPAADSITLTAGPLQATLSGDGGLRIGWDEPDWFGPLGVDVGGSHSAAWTSEHDGTFACEAGWVRAALRALDGGDGFVLRLEAIAEPPAPAADTAFDVPLAAWTFDPTARQPDGAPAGLRAFGHHYMQFALPVFSDESMQRWRLLQWRPAVVIPLGLVAGDGRTILLAPLDAFHEQVIAVPDRRHPDRHELLAGWHGDVGAVPQGFATELALIAGDGARACYTTWGRLLRERSGVAPAPRDSDTLGTRISYWTDNGSAYWYRTEPGHDPASGIVAAVDDLEARGVAVGSVQLDSWWYPHEVLRPFDTDEWEVPPTGMVRWEPRADVLPDGIASLRERLGRRPLVTHCRHLSSQSPYVNAMPVWVDGDDAHPQTPELYERLLDQAVAWGVEVLEHDWLVECFLGVRDLRVAGRAEAWQHGIDDALRARGLHAQWCMATPADFARATSLRQVTSIRTSGDHGYLVGPEMLWAWFLHNNVMARALGLWPYKDVFRTTPDRPEREVEALLAALSAGPVGVGDRVGQADVALIRRTCRADGVLVRPDHPIAATDAAMHDAPVWSGALLAASARTRHAAGTWSYVVTLNVGQQHEPARARVALESLGVDRPTGERVVAYDWRTGDLDHLDAGGSYDVALDALEWDHRVVAPVLAGGLAVIGDPALYATIGDTRIGDVAVDGDDVVVTVLAPHESVAVVGWSARPRSFEAWTPASGTAEVDAQYETASGMWRVVVDGGDVGWVRLRIR